MAYARTCPGPASELTALIGTLVDVVGALGAGHAFERNWGRWGAFLSLCASFGGELKRRSAPPIALWRWWPWTWLPAGMRADQACADATNLSAKRSQLEFAWRCAESEPQYSASSVPALALVSEAVGAGPVALAAGLPTMLLRSFERATEADMDAAVSFRKPLPDWSPALQAVNSIVSTAPHLALGALREMLSPEMTARLAQLTTVLDKVSYVQHLAQLVVSQAVGVAGANLAALQRGRSVAFLLPTAPVAAVSSDEVRPWTEESASAVTAEAAATEVLALGLATVRLAPLCGWSAGAAALILPVVPESENSDVGVHVLVPSAAAAAALAEFSGLRSLPSVAGLPSDVVVAAVDSADVLRRAVLSQSSRHPGYSVVAGQWVSLLPPQLRAAAARSVLLGRPVMQTRLRRSETKVSLAR